MVQKRCKLFVFIGVISLFLIVGCGRGGDDGAAGAPATPFLGGSEGLEIGFLQGNPPDEVTDGDTFPFKTIVILKNNGEHDLETTDVKVSLSGFFPSDFLEKSGDFTDNDLKNRPPTGKITARQRDSEGNIIEPIDNFVEFPKTGKDFKYKKKVAGNTPFTFKAEVCYKYQTRAVSELCALANMIDIADDAICDPSGTKPAFSSASPIKVTSFRQSVVGENKLQFSFDIVHSGSGDIFDPTIAADCPKTPKDRRQKEDEVSVTVKTGLTNDKLKCVGLTDAAIQSSKIVKLVDGKRTVTCTQELDTGRNDFKKNIDITLDFNYLGSTDKEVLVKHLVG